MFVSHHFIVSSFATSWKNKEKCRLVLTFVHLISWGKPRTPNFIIRPKAFLNQCWELSLVENQLNQLLEVHNTDLKMNGL